jgi:hypothetical protein
MEIVIRLLDGEITVKSLNFVSPADLPCLVARLPFASYWMSCHTASGRQVRGCAKLNRSEAIQKRCASCGSKGTFDFRLSFFPGKFPMRILRRTAPPGRQGVSLPSLVAPFQHPSPCWLSLSVPPQGDPSWKGASTIRDALSPPDTGTPKAVSTYGRRNPHSLHAQLLSSFRPALNPPAA